MKATSAVSSLLLVACLACPAGAAVLPDEAEDALSTARFRIAPPRTWDGGRWIYRQDTDKAIGYARWDVENRRYMLFDFQNRYHGYIQATIGDTKLEYYTQYLWYDKDNRYKGLFVLTLGGRPATRYENPYGELGGLMRPYEKGNILPPLPDYQPYTSPLDRYGVR